MKPADYRDLGIPKGVCEVVGSDDQRAGAFLGAEESQFLSAAYPKVTERHKVLWRVPS